MLPSASEWIGILKSCVTRVEVLEKTLQSLKNFEMFL